MDIAHSFDAQADVAAKLSAVQRDLMLSEIRLCETKKKFVDLQREALEEEIRAFSLRRPVSSHVLNSCEEAQVEDASSAEQNQFGDAHLKSDDAVINEADLLTLKKNYEKLYDEIKELRAEFAKFQTMTLKLNNPGCFSSFKQENNRFEGLEGLGSNQPGLTTVPSFCLGDKQTVTASAEGKSAPGCSDRTAACDDGLDESLSEGTFPSSEEEVSTGSSDGDCPETPEGELVKFLEMDLSEYRSEDDEDYRPSNTEEECEDEQQV